MKINLLFDLQYCFFTILLLDLFYIFLVDKLYILNKWRHKYFFIL